MNDDTTDEDFIEVQSSEANLVVLMEAALSNLREIVGLQDRIDTQRKRDYERGWIVNRNPRIDESWEEMIDLVARFKEIDDRGWGL